MLRVPSRPIWKHNRSDTTGLHCCVPCRTLLCCRFCIAEQVSSRHVRCHDWDVHVFVLRPNRRRILLACRRNKSDTIRAKMRSWKIWCLTFHWGERSHVIAVRWSVLGRILLSIWVEERRGARVRRK